MDRRAFIGSLAGGLLAAPLAARRSRQGRCTGLVSSRIRRRPPTGLGPSPGIYTSERFCADCANSATCMESIM